MGCVQSKESAVKDDKASGAPPAKPPAKTPAPEIAEKKAVTVVPDPAKPKMAPVVYIVYYSMYGHVKKMADSVAEGLKEAGVEAKLFQVPETLPEEVLGKMGAPPKTDDPIISAKDLPDADGIIFGIPTRFGMMAAQMKAFFDTTGGLWMSGGLVGKPASVFFSTAAQGGGQETTAFTTITQFAHHGMIYVPIGVNPAPCENHWGLSMEVPMVS